MSAALARVEIATEDGPDAESLVAVVPTHRRDIDIEEDVAEEVIRVIGYDQVPVRLPATEMPGYRQEPSLFVNSVRDLLAGRGLNEVLTNALIGPDDHARLGYGDDDQATIRVENPVSIDHSQMRRTMLPGMLGVLVRNERQRRDDLGFFEIGNLHEWRDGGPSQSLVLGIMLAGGAWPPSWLEPQRPASFEDAKGIIEALAARLNMGRVEFAATNPRPGIDHPGRTAAVVVSDGDERTGRTQVGFVLELDPRLLAAYEVHTEHVAFALLNLDVLEPLTQRVPQVRSAPALPIVERDIAVIVGRDTPAADVEAAIRRNAGDRLATVTLFDRYQGAPLDANQVSLAYRLRFQPLDEPLADSALDDAMMNVSQGLEREAGGRIRSGG
jgi:phenylalanyl-tRNA synthetase beta chain